jgi:hypothetical protein
VPIAGLLALKTFLGVPLQSGMRPSRLVRVLLQCVRRPRTLKGAASGVAFHYVMNLEAFRMDLRVSFNRFMYAAPCGGFGEPTFSLRTTLYYDSLTVRTKRRRYGYARNVCIDPPSPVECDWL